MKNKIFLVTILLSFFGAINAQETAKSISLNIKLPSSVIIKGTSTLHDWESVVEKTEAQLKEAGIGATDNNANSVLERLKAKQK